MQIQAGMRERREEGCIEGGRCRDDRTHRENQAFNDLTWQHVPVRLFSTSSKVSCEKKVFEAGVTNLDGIRI